MWNKEVRQVETNEKKGNILNGCCQFLESTVSAPASQERVATCTGTTRTGRKSLSWKTCRWGKQIDYHHLSHNIDEIGKEEIHNKLLLMDNYCLQWIVYLSLSIVLLLMKLYRYFSENQKTFRLTSNNTWMSCRDWVILHTMVVVESLTMWWMWENSRMKLCAWWAQCCDVTVDIRSINQRLGQVRLG